jgi:hypothetical protein
VHPVAIGLDVHRRTPDTGPHSAGSRLAHRAQRLQLADERRDRAAVEAHPRGELGRVKLTVAVQVGQHRPQVVASDRLLVGTGPRPAPGSHG